MLALVGGEGLAEGGVLCAGDVLDDEAEGDLAVGDLAAMVMFLMEGVVGFLLGSTGPLSVRSLRWSSSKLG